MGQKNRARKKELAEEEEEEAVATWSTSGRKQEKGGERGADYLRQLRGLSDSFRSMQIVMKHVGSSVRDQCLIYGGIYTLLWLAVEIPTVSAANFAAVVTPVLSRR